MASQGEQKTILSDFAKNVEWSSLDSSALYKYEGFWYPRVFIDGVMKAQKLDSSELRLSPSDVILCSSPKSGTTWLMALAFSIVTRTQFDPHSVKDNPLLTSFVQDLIPYIESNKPRNPHLPLLSTHIPYSALPKSVLPDSDSAGCKIVYICRNPKDVVVSLWHFLQKIGPTEKEPVPFDKSFDLFCQGVSSYGPYWDHVLGYWKASLDYPDMVLFLKYEDMMKDAGPHVRRLAEFMGYPFSKEEESQGIPARIMDVCSFGSLSKLEVNKADKYHSNGGAGTVTRVSNSIYFRKGKVGDWKNYLTDKMAAKLDDIVLDQNLGRFGLTL